jgi:hypothetical protein
LFKCKKILEEENFSSCAILFRICCMTFSVLRANVDKKKTLLLSHLKMKSLNPAWCGPEETDVLQAPADWAAAKSTLHVTSQQAADLYVVEWGADCICIVFLFHHQAGSWGAKRCLSCILVLLPGVMASLGSQINTTFFASQFWGNHSATKSILSRPRSHQALMQKHYHCPHNSTCWDDWLVGQKPARIVWGWTTTKCSATRLAKTSTTPVIQDARYTSLTVSS